MSRQTMMNRLASEIYAATAYDEKDFKPMDHRRVKRAAAIFEDTDWDTVETLNRIMGAEICSLGHRRTRS